MATAALALLLTAYSCFMIPTLLSPTYVDTEAFFIVSTAICGWTSRQGACPRPAEQRQAALRRRARARAVCDHASCIVGQLPSATPAAKQASRTVYTVRHPGPSCRRVRYSRCGQRRASDASASSTVPTQRASTHCPLSANQPAATTTIQFSVSRKCPPSFECDCIMLQSLVHRLMQLRCALRARPHGGPSTRRVSVVARASAIPYETRLLENYGQICFCSCLTFLSNNAQVGRATWCGRPSLSAWVGCTATDGW